MHTAQICLSFALAGPVRGAGRALRHTYEGILRRLQDIVAALTTQPGSGGCCPCRAAAGADKAILNAARREGTGAEKIAVNASLLSTPAPLPAARQRKQPRCGGTQE